MRPITPSFAFIVSLPIGVLLYLVGVPWQHAIVLGVFLPLLMAYMALISLARERQLAWELCDSRWYWILVLPLALAVLSIAGLLIAVVGDFLNLFVHVVASMLAAGFLSIAVAGCVVILLDLTGRVPLKRP